MRELVAESHLRVDDLIAPLFVREGIDTSRSRSCRCPASSSTPGRRLRDEVAELGRLGVRSVILFGVPATQGRRRQRRVRSRRRRAAVASRDLRADVGDDVVVMADLCVDEYTDHGHCGIVDEHGVVDNDATLEIYAEAAVAQARAGAHVVAPSGMMDGQVGGDPRRARRRRVTTDVAILAYAAKYASALYGPFRDAVDVTIVGGGDRKGYQQDWRNAREALREIDADIAEGADMVMVKPALAYLDVIADGRGARRRPVAAYHVSGEYAMIKAAAANGLDRPRRRGPRAPHGDQAGRRRHRSSRTSPAGSPRPSPMAGSRDDGDRPAATRSLRRPPVARRRCAPAPACRRTTTLFERSTRAIPGGVNSSIRAFKAVGGEPYVVAGAEGPYVWDVEGTTLHRPGAELRRGHPRPRPPGDHRGRRAPRPATARRTARRRRGR